MAPGYLLLHRKARSNDLWTERRVFSKWEAWLDLLFDANWKDGKMTIDLTTVEIKRGEQITSMKKLARRWKWSQPKVKRYFLFLQTAEQVSFKTGRKWTSLKILNYDKYQPSAETTLLRRGSNVNQTLPRRGSNVDNRMKNKNLKKNNEGNKEIHTGVPPAAEAAPSPIWPGCEHLRMTEAEHSRALAAILKRGLAPEMIDACIEEVDSWLSQQNNPKAAKARKDSTHYRRIYAAWVVRNVLVVRNGSSNGRPGAESLDALVARLAAQEAQDATK